MKYEVVQDGGNVRFIVEGEIDEAGAQELKIRFEKLDFAAIKGVVFDFSAVTRIGSAGLGKLLLFYKKLATINATMRIEKTNPEIRELLVELNLSTLFAVS